MNAEEKYDLIERYLDQQMTEVEKADFEKLLEKDAELKEELGLHQQITTSLKGEKIHEFRHVLKETDQNWKSVEAVPNTKVKKINFRRVIAIAATVLLLIMAYQFFFVGGGQRSNDQLFADNFQPYQMLLSQRDISKEDINTLLEKAISTYTKGDFQNASLAFQQLAENDPEDISYSFYQAVSELGAKNSDEAIALFNGILAAGEHSFVEQSRWYLALAYMQKGDTMKAEKVLKEIRSGQFKYAEAKQLLEKLK